MLHFLRKIRNQMMLQSKLGSYLLYAIGEITLVVIGILIAVSIDGWNDYRKERLVEKEILEEIAENLESNISLMEQKVSFYEFVNSSTDLLMSLRGTKSAYHDSLGIHIYSAIVLAANFHIPSPAYEVLKSKGFNIIENKSLRKEIVSLFDESYPLTNLRFKDIKERYPHLQQFIDENFWTVRLSATPIYPEKLFGNTYFFSLIYSIKLNRSDLARYLRDDLEKTKHVLALIRSSRHTDIEQ